jgi:hypothetical protein
MAVAVAVRRRSLLVAQDVTVAGTAQDTLRPVWAAQGHAAVAVAGVVAHRSPVA